MHDTKRFNQERRTISAMIGIYCRDRHGSPKGRLCAACAEVLAYAEARLDKCIFPDTKPTCANCPVHCYKPAMRTQVKEIMRYAGPRMAWRHPWRALRHYLHGMSQRDVTIGKKRGPA